MTASASSKPVLQTCRPGTSLGNRAIAFPFTNHERLGNVILPNEAVATYTLNLQQLKNLISSRPGLL